MKVLLIYYSPTNNTKYVAEKIKREFENYLEDSESGDRFFNKLSNTCDKNNTTKDAAKENGVENNAGYSPVEVTIIDATKCGKIIEKTQNTDNDCDTNECQNCDTPNLFGYDLIGLGYPIHAFNPPKAFYNFVKRLNFDVGQKVFLFKTSGEPHPFNNASSKDIKRVLKRKKAQVISDFHFLMPYYIMFRHSDELVKKMVITNDSLIKVFVYKLLKGERYFVKSNIFCNAVSDIFKIEWSGASLLGRKFAAFDSCDGCQICQINCPQNNIKIENGKAVHGKNCNICMACVAFCPKNAVNTRYMERWKVVGKYDFDKISRDGSLSNDYLKSTKEFLGIYEKYFDKAQKLINEYNKENNR